MTVAETYPKLVSELKRIERLHAIEGLVGWDEQVNLPPGAANDRGEQAATLAEIIHREETRPELGDLLASLEADKHNLTEDQQVVVREARRDYDQLTKLSPELVQRRAKAESEGYHAWAKARAEDHFDAFVPFLRNNLAIAIEVAKSLAPNAHPYDTMIDRFDPGMDEATVDSLFTPLRAELKPLVETILNSGVTTAHDKLKGFPIDKQETFLREVVTKIGFDFNHGRLDIALHPFCGGAPYDVRMTTRYDVDNPLDSWSSSCHETGHALYEQGLPREHVGTPLGDSVGMAVHESQSRIIENQIGRSRPFWQYWEPRYRELFPQQLNGISSDELFLAVNRVAISAIRVDSDEVTYNLHIMLRFELEKRLVSGSLDVKDLPEAWNALSTEIIGYTPKSNKEGCLQDVHWSGGMFGYFPSYCLGNLLAAQLWFKLRADLPDLDEQIATANFQPAVSWLRQHIHHQGRRYRTQELSRRATGKPLGHEDLIRYLKERYLPLYTN